MLRRKSALAGVTPGYYPRANNDESPHTPIRRIVAFTEEYKVLATDESHSELAAADASFSAGANSTFWSEDIVNLRLRSVSIASASQLDSPKDGTTVGGPPNCTGGGHGEAAPSSNGRRFFGGSDPTYGPQTLVSSTAKVTPLARHVAERSLLSGMATNRHRDNSLPQAGPFPPASPALTPSSPFGEMARRTSSCVTLERLPGFMRTGTSTAMARAAEASQNYTATRGPDAQQLSQSPTLPNPFASGSSFTTTTAMPWGPAQENPQGPQPIGYRTSTPCLPTTALRPTRRISISVRAQRTPSLISTTAHDGYLDGSPTSSRPTVMESSDSFSSKPEPSLPSFVTRPPPTDGLVHLSLSAPKAMHHGDWAMAEFTIARQLYNGYASAVYKATCLRSGQDVVLKVYTLTNLSDFLRNQVLRELDIHSRLDHPGVVQLLAAFKEDDKLVLVLEYVRGGSLDRARRKLGGRLSEQQALELVMVPLLRTLHYLHTQSIVHRDIKPANLLFTPDWRLKVCDYGVSICLTEERAVTRTGSRDYMAPEVHACPLKRLPHDNKDNPRLAYGAAADVWSVGALLYEMLVGFTPFPGGPPCKRNAGDTRTLPFPSRISADARAFVLACLEHRPEDRPSIAELRQFAWVQGAALRTQSELPASPKPAVEAWRGASSGQAPGALPDMRGRLL
ncbi:hypothetical protein Agub_g3251 [Astrephomene gubernaculifera]|uniref:Protein kinase domain-containing protein n=1 Tax=Astrephomene gubernaculifera TaxID=47775 RepID=A0AAD3DIB2_9CHLO|nr:hypothetical protein Agub_g3251 [Astrephomene gubernaculifera]